MTGLESAVSFSTVSCSSPLSSSRRIWSWKLSVASSSTRCELSLFFRIAWIADGVPTVTLIGVPSSTPSSSIIGRSVGSDTTMTSVVPFAPVRHEAVAQHQVGRDRAEQLVIDAELRQVDELEPVALGQLRRGGCATSRPLAPAVRRRLGAPT